MAASNVLDRVQLELVAAVSDGRTPSFTVSAGISDTTESEDYQTLLALADERLLAAKRSGRNAILTRLSDSLRDRQRRIVATTVARDPALTRRFLAEHHGICEAIAAGDARAAGRLVEAHIEGSRAGMEAAT